MGLASDGTKMSKRLKNYPPPIEVVDKYGADAVRLFLINSPVVKAENLRFREDGVLAILKDVFLPWYNAFRFLLQNIDLYEREEGVEFTWGESSYGGSDNVMDKWIISFTQSLLDFVAKEMAAYRLYTVLPRLIKFIDNLTNWYVRMNRKRLKGEGGAADCKAALDSLFSVLITMVRAKLELNISPGFPADYAGAVSNSATDSGDSGQQPASDWLNLELVGCQAARHVGAATRAGILLTGQLTDWSIERLTGCAQDIFGLHGVKLDLYYKANKSDKVENLKFLKNNTVYVFTGRSKAGTASQKSGFNCKFLNVSKKGGETTSLLLENPVGCPLDNIQEAMKKLKISCLYKDETKKSKVNVTQLNNMAGLTLYA